MSKELPFFRFTVSEWLNDDISLESYLLKGLFIDVCSFYWFKDCSITKAMLEKRFSDANIQLNELIELKIIKINKKGIVSILFLDDQYDMLSEKRKNRQLAGKKGGLMKSRNAKAMLKQNPSYKDKYNNKDNNKDKDNKTPSLFDVKSYFKEKKYKEEIAEKAFNFYESLDWKDSKGKEIKNWKNKMVNVWFKPENKSSIVSQRRLVL